MVAAYVRVLSASGIAGQPEPTSRVNLYAPIRTGGYGFVDDGLGVAGGAAVKDATSGVGAGGVLHATMPAIIMRNSETAAPENPGFSDRPGDVMVLNLSLNRRRSQSLTTP